jgi:molybdate transport system substrate-binding protein
MPYNRILSRCLAILIIIGLCLWSGACDTYIDRRLEKQINEVAKSTATPGTTAPAATTTLTIAAASSLEPPLREIATIFQANQKVSCHFSFAASGTLARQLENGAPFDVFCAADPTTIQKLQAQKLLLGQPRTVARGQLVLYWQNTNQQFNQSFKQVADLKLLTSSTIKQLALPNPATAPYGQAAQQLLEKLGWWSAVQNKVVYAESVNNARQYVLSGNTEVAFIARSLVPASETYLQLPLELYQPLNQVVAVTAASQQSLVAQQFVDFLTSEAAQQIFINYGYALPTADQK